MFTMPDCRTGGVEAADSTTARGISSSVRARNARMAFDKVQPATGEQTGSIKHTSGVTAFPGRRRTNGFVLWLADTREREMVMLRGN